MVVSHDRYLLERTCDRYLRLVGDGRLRDLPGGVEQYLALRSGAAGPGQPAAAVRTASSADPAPGTGAADVRTAKKGAARLERQVERAETEISRLHGELAANATDANAVLRLNAELRRTAVHKDELEERWLEVMSAVEEAG